MPILAQSPASDSTDSSVNILAEVSLWHEFHKNGDFQSSLKHGWIVLREDPTFIKYKYYKKMEEMLWYMHDSVAATDDEKMVYADTLMYLYEKALTNDEKNKNYFLARRAYVMEEWYDLPAEEVIAAYETASEADPELADYYMDRYGLLLIANATDENGYKLKALTLYSDLSAKDPENELWIDRMKDIADNPEELADITEKSWLLDKENKEKAFTYAMNCIRIKDYERAIVPWEFLVEKAPDVINYWNQLATCYDKVDRVDDALKAYKTLVDLQPENRDNYVNIAIIYKKLDQLSVARSYLQKAANVSPDWDYPHYIEAQIYEQAARSCSKEKFEFEDKVVYQLAVDTYRIAARKGGSYSSTAAERANSLAQTVPSREDYFFRKLNAGDEIKVDGKCYDWIGRTITVPN
jgi:tetratricopeptide (TPR) repeat protein